MVKPISPSDLDLPLDEDLVGIINDLIKENFDPSTHSAYVFYKDIYNRYRDKCGITLQVWQIIKVFDAYRYSGWKYLTHSESVGFWLR